MTVRELIQTLIEKSNLDDDIIWYDIAEGSFKDVSFSRDRNMVQVNIIDKYRYAREIIEDICENQL